MLLIDAITAYRHALALLTFNSRAVIYESDYFIIIVFVYY